MPTVTVEGEKSFEVEAGKKLVLAIEDAGIDVMHRCGGNARCTTCRVEVLAGDPAPAAEVEIERLARTTSRPTSGSPARSGSSRTFGSRSSIDRPKPASPPAPARWIDDRRPGLAPGVHAISGRRRSRGKGTTRIARGGTRTLTPCGTGT